MRLEFLQRHVVILPPEIDLDHLTVLNDLKDRLAQVRPDQIEHAARKFDPPQKREKVVGTIEQESTRGLYTLSVILGAESKIKFAEAQLETDPIKEEELRGRAIFLDSLEDLAHELFWCQAKVDIGCYQPNPTIGLRKDWQLVTNVKPEHPLARFLPMGLPGLPELE